MEKDENPYTKEMTEDIISSYLASPTKETVENLCKKYNKPLRSVVGKLSRTGIYKKPGYVSKNGEKPITKEGLVGLIAQEAGWDEWEVDGLEKAPKELLKKLLNKLKELNDQV